MVRNKKKDKLTSLSPLQTLQTYIYTQKIEEAGEEGRVQEATELTAEVEKLQTEMGQLKDVSDTVTQSRCVCTYIYSRI